MKHFAFLKWKSTFCWQTSCIINKYYRCSDIWIYPWIDPIPDPALMVTRIRIRDPASLSFIWYHFVKSYVNPSNHGRFLDTNFKVIWEGVKLFFLYFFIIGASATKSFSMSRIFEYGLTRDIMSKGQETKAREGGLQDPNPPGLRG